MIYQNKENKPNHWLRVWLEVAVAVTNVIFTIINGNVLIVIRNCTAGLPLIKEIQADQWLKQFESRLQNVLFRLPVQRWHLNFILAKVFNSYLPSAAFMRQWAGSSLVQVMASRLIRTKPLPELMLAYCVLDSWEHISVIFEIELYHFYSRKNIWKCRLLKRRPFCPEGDDFKNNKSIVIFHSILLHMSDFWDIRSLLCPISRLRDFTRFGSKTFYHFVNRGPELMLTMDSLRPSDAYMRR